MKDILSPGDLERLMQRAVDLVGPQKAVMILGFASGLQTARSMQPKVLALLLHELRGDDLTVDGYILSWAGAIEHGAEQERQQAHTVTL
jgi:hypothetical protein